MNYKCHKLSVFAYEIDLEALGLGLLDLLSNFQEVLQRDRPARLLRLPERAKRVHVQNARLYVLYGEKAIHVVNRLYMYYHTCSCIVSTCIICNSATFSTQNPKP